MNVNDHTYFSYGEDEMREVIVRIYPRVVAYIRKMLGGREMSCTAEDIFQEAVCCFMEKRPHILRDKVSAYLMRIVRNNTLNMLTRSYVDRLSVRVDFQQVSALDVLAAVESEEASVMHDVDSVPVQDIIKFSDRFSPRMQEVFYLSRVKGLTHHEIAEHLGISTRMVERYLAQSVTLYRQYFDYHHDDELAS